MPNIEDCVAEAQSFRPLRRLSDCAKAPQKETQMSPREDWLFEANRAADAEALAVYRNTVLRAAEDVENALSGLAQTEADVIELQDEVQSLVKACDLAEQAYRAGSITLTDVLDADRQLLVAQDELDANRAGAARAAVGVFRALGGGWDSQDHIATRHDGRELPAKQPSS